MIDRRPRKLGARIRRVSTPLNPPLIRANLAALGEIEAGSANLRMSGVGLLPAKLDSTTQTISCQIKTPLEPDAYTVIVSAKSNGRKLEGRWSFTVKPVSRPALAKGPQ